MDAGIIRNFKLNYQKILMSFIVDQYKKFVLPDVKQSIKIACEAWNMVTKETIQNCFRHCDILEGEKKVNNSSIEEEISNKLLTFAELVKLHVPDFADAILTAEEFLNIEENEATSSVLT